MSARFNIGLSLETGTDIFCINFTDQEYPYDINQSPDFHQFFVDKICLFLLVVTGVKSVNLTYFRQNSNREFAKFIRNGKNLKILKDAINDRSHAQEMDQSI